MRDCDLLKAKILDFWVSREWRSEFYIYIYVHIIIKINNFDIYIYVNYI